MQRHLGLARHRRFGCVVDDKVHAEPRAGHQLERRFFSGADAAFHHVAGRSFSADHLELERIAIARKILEQTGLRSIAQCGDDHNLFHSEGIDRGLVLQRAPIEE